jgi:hypothetical protein
MDIHKPKPVHSWREFFSEIIVIVTGIVIALRGRKVVEAIHWHHKVQSDLSRTPETVDRQLAAIQRLRSDENGRLAIAEAMLDYAHEKLPIAASNSAYIASNGAHAKACEAQVLATQTAAKH